MKTSKTIAVIGAALLMCAGASAQAQIVWTTGATNISADTDVATNGTLLYADYIGGAATDEVNGVTFTSVDAAGAGIVDPNNGGALNSANYNAYGIPPVDGTDGFTGSANYVSLLSSLYYDNTAPLTLTLTLTGLTSGQTYEFQEFDQDGRDSTREAYLTTATDGNSVTLSANPNGTDGNGVGQFAIGSFTATGSTETITLQGATGLTVQINAFQVRDITAPVEAPEPTSVALIGLGALALLIHRRRLAL